MASNDGKGVALVTGGGSGIGAAAAERLSADGYDVVVVDVDGGRAGEVADRLGCDAITADVGAPDDWLSIAARLEARVGRVAVVVLNAGVVDPVNDLLDLRWEDYRRVFAVNVDGVALGVRAMAPLMTEGGSIIVTASRAGLVPATSYPAYTAAKHAVVGLVRALAPALRPRKIRINAVCPGLVATSIISTSLRERARESGFAFLDPAAVAAVMVDHLLGPETGQAWLCQSGLTPMPYEFPRIPGGGLTTTR